MTAMESTIIPIELIPIYDKIKPHDFALEEVKKAIAKEKERQEKRSADANTEEVRRYLLHSEV